MRGGRRVPFMHRREEPAWPGGTRRRAGRSGACLNLAGLATRLSMSEPRRQSSAPYSSLVRDSSLRRPKSGVELMATGFIVLDEPQVLSGGPPEAEIEPLSSRGDTDVASIEQLPRCRTPTVARRAGRPMSGCSLSRRSGVAIWQCSPGVAPSPQPPSRFCGQHRACHRRKPQAPDGVSRSLHRSAWHGRPAQGRRAGGGGRRRYCLCPKGPGDGSWPPCRWLPIQMRGWIVVERSQ